nr:DUF1482 family protein [Escherichia coli]
MTVFLITGESQNVITGIYASKESCLQARDEQKISGECLNVNDFSICTDDDGFSYNG